MKPLGLLTAILVTLCLSISTAFAEVRSATVAYKDGDENLTGYLYWNDAVEGKRPGVLVVHEWWGLNEYAKSRAEQLAELGYVAFAVDMYGGDRDYVADRARAMLRITRALSDAGLPVFLGTDAPTPGLVPGEALHREMRWWHQAGIPLETIWKIATSGAGRRAACSAWTRGSASG